MLFSNFKKNYYEQRKKLKVSARNLLLQLRPATKPKRWQNDQCNKVLIFCPEAGIAPHFDALQVLGKMIENGGAEVRWVRC